MRLELTPALELGLVRLGATLEDPDVRLCPWKQDMPTISVEEAGVVLQLEFVDDDAFLRFQERVARLHVRGDRG